jgi:hypothetical protein
LHCTQFRILSRKLVTSGMLVARQLCVHVNMWKIAAFTAVAG